MPTLFKRSNGVYYIVFETADGKRKWKSTGKTHKRDALNVLSSFNKERPRAIEKKVLLADFLKEFLSYADGIYNPGTVDIYSKSLRNFLGSTGDHSLSSICERQIDSFKKDRLKEIKPVTLNIELRTLRAAFNFAVRWKLLETNPFKNVALCRIEDKLPLFIKFQEFQVLFRSIREPWLRDLVIVAGLTGMRRGELVNVQWEDIDFQRGIIVVQPRGAFMTKFGKRRSVPMNRSVEEILRRRWLERESESGYAFTKQGRKIPERMVTRKFKKYARKLGLVEEIHFHCLRHSFASWLVQDGVSIYEVQKLLGHSSIKTTEIYSHLVPEQLRKTVNRLQLEPN